MNHCLIMSPWKLMDGACLWRLGRGPLSWEDKLRNWSCHLTNATDYCSPQTLCFDKVPLIGKSLPSWCCGLFYSHSDLLVQVKWFCMYWLDLDCVVVTFGWRYTLHTLGQREKYHYAYIRISLQLLLNVWKWRKCGKTEWEPIKKTQRPF